MYLVGRSSHLKDEPNVFHYGLFGGAGSLPMKQWG